MQPALTADLKDTIATFQCLTLMMRLSVRAPLLYSCALGFSHLGNPPPSRMPLMNAASSDQGILKKSLGSCMPISHAASSPDATNQYWEVSLLTAQVV